MFDASRRRRRRGETAERTRRLDIAKILTTANGHADAAYPWTIGGKAEIADGGATHAPLADSGDERTSLRPEPISTHRQSPSDPGPRMAGPDEKDAYVVAVPSGFSWVGSRHVRASADAPHPV